MQIYSVQVLHLRTHPCKCRKHCPDRSRQAGSTCANCGGGTLGPYAQPLQPPPAAISTCANQPGALTSPHFSPSAAAHSPLLLAHHWHVCYSLLFCTALALHWRGGPSPQLPSSCLLTLRRKVAKLQEQNVSVLLPSPPIRIGLGRLRPSWPSVLLFAPLTTCTWDGLVCLPPSKRVLAYTCFPPRA